MSQPDAQSGPESPPNEPQALTVEQRLEAAIAALRALRSDAIRQAAAIDRILGGG